MGRILESKKYETLLKETKIFCPRKKVNLYVRIDIRHHLG